MILYKFNRISHHDYSCSCLSWSWFSSTWISLWILLVFSFISSAVNPGCKCIRFTSTYGKPFGVFNSPDYPLNYPQGVSCLLYSFQAPKDYIVHVLIENYNLLSPFASSSSSSNHHLKQQQNRQTATTFTSGCGNIVGSNGDYLKLFLHLEEDGVNELTPWNTILCGKGSNQSFYSSSRHLIIQFHSKASGVLTRSTVNNPAIIASSSSGVVPLSFLGRFRFLNSSQFEANGRLVPGTKCDYRFLSANYTAAEGRFFSPRYPSSYPHNSKCSYYFHASLHERVKIVFESVALQPNEASCLNKTDVIRVLDGSNIKSPVIAFICNTAAEYEVVSSGPDLIVEFISNSEDPGEGFVAKFHFIKIQLDNTIANNIRMYQNFQHYEGMNFGPDGLLTQASTLVPQCNQIITSDAGKNGSFTSPNYPHSLTPKTHCTYEFIGHGKERVQISFMDFSLHVPAGTSEKESYNNNNKRNRCEGGDSLAIFVPSKGKLAKLVGNFCGFSAPMPLMSSSHKLTIQLNAAATTVTTNLQQQPSSSSSSSSSPSLRSNNNRGFSALYYFVEDFGVKTGKQLIDYPCAFVYNGSEMPNGTFTSPNFEGYYPRDTECHYFFNGNENEHVEIQFTYFNVHGFGTCDEDTESDYVEFSNYMWVDTKFKKMCGQIRDLWVQSDRKFFRVTFRSNSKFDATGFSANYIFTDKPNTNKNRKMFNTPFVNAAATEGRRIGILMMTGCSCFIFQLLVILTIVMNLYG